MQSCKSAAGCRQQRVSPLYLVVNFVVTCFAGKPAKRLIISCKLYCSNSFKTSTERQTDSHLFALRSSRQFKYLFVFNWAATWRLLQISQQEKAWRDRKITRGLSIRSPESWSFKQFKKSVKPILKHSSKAQSFRELGSYWRYLSLVQP